MTLEHPSPISLSTPSSSPTPQLWSDVFSSDPDSIICRKYCKCSCYNFRWFSHCFMCHICSWNKKIASYLLPHSMYI
jgi:hypothetical protein